MHLREPTSVPQLALTVLIIGFVLLVRLDLVTSKILLAFIFLAAAASALVTPVWQSIVPLLVSRTLLQPAIALNGVGADVSRATGLISGASIFSAKHSKSMLFLAFGLIVYTSRTGGLLGSTSFSSIGAWPKMPMTAGSLPPRLTPS